MLKVAVAQTNSQDDVAANLKTVQKLIEQASQSGAKLILLPENFAFMGSEYSKLDVAENIGSGLIQDSVARFAQDNKIWIIAGTIPIASQTKDKVYAASMLYNDNGEMVCRYDKIHLFDVKVSNTEAYNESNTIVAGSTPKVFKAPFATIGLSVCYDVRFPELFRTYVNARVDILSIPAAFVYNTGKVHWHILTQARAIENQMFVLAANQDGTHPGDRKTYGHSMIIDPWGKIIVEQQSQPGVIIADLDLEAMHKLRQSFPVHMHRKL